MTDRKNGNRRNQRQGLIPKEEEIEEYKNQNVLFKIHTAKGQQDYSGKQFPGKFSINITNEAAQLSSRMPASEYNGQLQTSIGQKISMPNLTSQRFTHNLDFDRHEASINEKRKQGMLVKELEQTCIQYERRNLDLLNSIDNLTAEIKKLTEKLGNKEKCQAELLQSLATAKRDRKELEAKICMLELELKKQAEKAKKDAQKNRNLQASLQAEILSLQNKIASLQMLISEKEQTIRNISNFNNEIAKNIIEEQSNFSKSQVKQTERWYKSLRRKENNINTTPQNEPNEQISFPELLAAYQEAMGKIIELEKVNCQIQVELTRMQNENQALIANNQEYTTLVDQLRTKIYNKENQKDKSTQDNFYRKNKGSEEQKNLIFYQGTVKVKMQSLLIQKDKRIHSLQNQLMQVRRENTILKAKTQQAQQLNTTREWAYNDLKRVKSLSNFIPKSDDRDRRFFASDCNGKFFASEPNGFQDKENVGGELKKDLLYQCSNLSEILGNFMENCKHQRSTSCRHSQNPCLNEPSEKCLQFSRVNEQNTNSPHRIKKACATTCNSQWIKGASGTSTTNSAHYRSNSIFYTPEYTLPRFEEADQDGKNCYY